MLIAYLFLSVTIISAAIFVVFGLIHNEQKLERKLKLGEGTDPPLQKSPSIITPAEVLKRLNIVENAAAPKTSASTASSSPMASGIAIPEIPKEEANKSNQAESELLIKYEDSIAQYRDLQTKYEKLSSLLEERTSLAEKSEKSLNHELKNRKEFNKIKDILERELKEYRDKTKELQASLTTAQIESQSQLKRIIQLEENITKLEKNILAKDEEIKTAQGEIQTERIRAAELITQLHKNQEILREKDKKIEGLVERLKTHSLPPEQTSSERPAPVTDVDQTTTTENKSSDSGGGDSTIAPNSPAEGTNGMDVNNVYPSRDSSTFVTTELTSLSMTTHDRKSPGHI